MAKRAKAVTEALRELYARRLEASSKLDSLSGEKAFLHAKVVAYTEAIDLLESNPERPHDTDN